METLNKHEIVNIIFRDEKHPPLHYTDAELSIDSSTDSYVVKAIVELPIEESDPENPNKPIPTKYFNIIERIARHEVLRIYTLDTCK